MASVCAPPLFRATSGVSTARRRTPPPTPTPPPRLRRRFHFCTQAASSSGGGGGETGGGLVGVGSSRRGMERASQGHLGLVL
jgi:hypothetical protein